MPKSLYTKKNKNNKPGKKGKRWGVRVIGEAIPEGPPVYCSQRTKKRTGTEQNAKNG